MNFIKRFFSGEAKSDSDTAAQPSHPDRPLSQTTQPSTSSTPDKISGATQKTPTWSKDHPAAKEIAEVEDAASKLIEIKVVGDGAQTITSTNSTACFDLIAKLDKALEKSANDPDLIYARASLNYMALQGEDGQKDREKCLALTPDHFDATMKRDHFQSWETIFNLPHWDEAQTALPDLMMKHLEMNHCAQVVRDHLRGAIAIVVPENKVNLAGCSRMRWELKWASTPLGSVATHYLFFDNKTFLELFIPHTSAGAPMISSNYWLLRRLALEKHCFIVITRDRSVVRNERFIFPTTLLQTLDSMSAELKKCGPVSSTPQFQKAAQWYMQNTDESSLKY